ncbi:transcriptional regulator swi6 [Cladochytrium tenue]|nr:transcriptional regulator swi6 [Cladochytrium tenue]
MPSQGASSPVRPAIYSSVNVFEQVCRGVPVMRRAKDAYINATQILRAAGLPKTQRTKILERDVCTGMHEKVQGGYHMFQGTWIPLNSAVILSRDHGLEAALSPLFKFEPPESTAAIFADILAERKAAKVGGGLAGPSTNIVSAEPRLSSPTRTSFESTSSSDPADEDREEKDDDDAADEDYAPRKPRPGAANPELVGHLGDLPGDLLGGLRVILPRVALQDDHPVDPGALEVARLADRLDGPLSIIYLLGE